MKRKQAPQEAQKDAQKEANELIDCLSIHDKPSTSSRLRNGRNPRDHERRLIVVDGQDRRAPAIELTERSSTTRLSSEEPSDNTASRASLITDSNHPFKTATSEDSPIDAPNISRRRLGKQPSSRRDKSNISVPNQEIRSSTTSEAKRDEKQPVKKLESASQKARQPVPDSEMQREIALLKDALSAHDNPSSPYRTRRAGQTQGSRLAVEQERNEQSSSSSLSTAEASSIKSDTTSREFKSAFTADPGPIGPVGKCTLYSLCC